MKAAWQEGGRRWCARGKGREREGREKEKEYKREREKHKARDGIHGEYVFLIVGLHIVYCIAQLAILVELHSAETCTASWLSGLM